MKRILITGVAGSGKSTLANRLSSLGFNALDIEGVPGMFKMLVKDSGEEFIGYEAGNVEMIEKANWVCDVKMLGGLLTSQSNELGLYFGVASNLGEIVHFFDKIFVLVVGSKFLYERLLNRNGKDDIGGTEQSRQYVLENKRWWEESIRDLGAMEITADESVDVVARKIIEQVSS